MANVLPNMEHALEWAEAQDGKSYLIFRPFDFDDPGFDCSALVLLGCRKACERAGKPQDYLFPYSVSNTVGMYLHARARGWLRPVASGVGLRASIMLKGRDYGGGSAGHTAYSGGNGYQYAAHTARLPQPQEISWSPMVASYYQDAIIFPPDVAFYPDRDTIPVDPDVLAWLAHLEEWLASFDHERVADGRKYGYLTSGDTNGRVTTLNQLLILRGFIGPGRQSNTYNRYTQTAVANGKELAGLDGGGKKVGADFAHALVHPG